jgi:hypothetical protein
VLAIYDLISKSEPDDVRWEKVKQFKLILTTGAYPVAPDQVAARLIDQMLERGSSHLRRRQSKLSSKTNVSSVGTTPQRNGMRSSLSERRSKEEVS